MLIITSENPITRLDIKEIKKTAKKSFLLMTMFYCIRKPLKCKYLASGGQGDSFRENHPPGPPTKAFGIPQLLLKRR